jgi:hypothetical protein
MNVVIGSFNVKKKNHVFILYPIISNVITNIPYVYVQVSWKGIMFDVV